MALTYTPLGYDYVHIPPFELMPVDIAFDNSYATGGYTLGSSAGAGVTSAHVVGFTQLGGNAALAGYEVVYNTSTQKLIAYKSGAGATSTYSGADLKGAINPTYTAGVCDQAVSDQTTIPTNAALWYGGNTFTTMAGTATITTQPDIPRNVMLTIENTTGGALNLYEGTTTYTVTGTDYLGNVLTEAITWASTSGNKSVAANKFRYLCGVKPFATISTVTYDNAAAGSLTLYVGPATRIGLPGTLATATYTDVKDINITAASYTPGNDITLQAGVDTTYNAINVGTCSANWDFTFVYNAAANEVASGTNLSGVTVRGVIWRRI